MFGIPTSCKCKVYIYKVMFTYARLYIHNKKMVSSSYFKRPLVQHEHYNSIDMQSAHVAHLHAFYNKKYVFSILFVFAPHRRWVVIARWYFLPTYTIYSIIFMFNLSQNQMLHTTENYFLIYNDQHKQYPLTFRTFLR